MVGRTLVSMCRCLVATPGWICKEVEGQGNKLTSLKAVMMLDFFYYSYVEGNN